MVNGKISVKFQLSAVNGWFIRGLAVPFVSVDGRETQATWSEGAKLDVDPGDHDIAGYFRYRGFRSHLGEGHCSVSVGQDDDIHVVARNGVMNQTPFRLAIV